MQQQPPQPPTSDSYGEPMQPIGQPPFSNEPTQPISQPPPGRPESASVQPPQTVPQQPETAYPQPMPPPWPAPMQQPGAPFAAPSQAAPQSVPPARATWVSFSRLRGHPLIDISEGKTIGTVDDLLLDQKRQTIQAFLTRGGLFHKASLVPALRARIGEDAVTFQPGALAGQDTSWLEALPKASQLIGMRVLTNTGQLLGRVEELRIDPEGAGARAAGENAEAQPRQAPAAAGAGLLAMELGPEQPGAAHRLGSARGLLPTTGVISYGPDTIIAQEGAVSEL